MSVSVTTRLLVRALVVVLSVTGLAVPASGADRDETQWVDRLVELINTGRRDQGLEMLEPHPDMAAVASTWARRQAHDGHMRANPHYRSQIPAGHTACGEAVAWGQSTPESMYAALTRTAGPAATLANPGFTHVGVGVAFDTAGRPYATIDLARYTDPVEEGEQWSARILELLNADRAEKGMAPVERVKAMDEVALAWSRQQAAERRMYHNPNHRQQIPPGHVLAGENVAWGQPTPERMYRRWYQSPGHYANMFSPDFTHIGIGVAFTPDGWAYGTQNFARYESDGGVAGGGYEFHLAGTLTGPARYVFRYGDPQARVYVGDWDGDGRDSLAYRIGSTFYVRNSNSAGGPDLVFSYGRPGDRVYVGDWDGDGRDTFAVRRGRTYHVTNRLAGGDADRVVTYGRPGDDILVGDWDGDGRDTFAVRRGHTYYVTNRLAGGDADRVVTYGRPGDDILVGDWDGDGRDTFAVRRGRTYYVTNRLAGGDADRVVTYGRPGDDILVGDWDGDGRDTFAVRRGHTYYVKNRIAGGDADHVVRYGRSGDTTLVGDWDGDGRDTFGVRRSSTR